MIEIQGLHVSYGEFLALQGIDCFVEKGELVTIIGANGAGKTTILKAVMGLTPPRDGRILLNRTDITRMPSHQRALLGIRLVPEGRRIFGDLTVRENLAMGAYTQQNKTEITRSFSKVFHLFPVLEARQKQIGKTLSGGEQQMLAIARALMADPQVVLMDEISLGLMPIFVSETFKIIRRLHEKGVTILLVEQNARKALAVADRGYVLETGKILLSGSSRDLAAAPVVKQAYLGA